MDWGLVFWTILSLGPLLWLVRQVHQGLQALFLLMTGHVTLSLYLYQILLIPGVALHELSHYVFAKLLGVRVRSFSLRPSIQGENIQMGAVTVDRSDFIRGLLIGMAPLITGSAVVVLIGQHIFEVSTVIEAAQYSEADPGAIWDAIQTALKVNDAGIWLYLIFAVSNAMLPSKADRQGLWPVVIFGGLIVLIAFLAGRGLELLSQLAGPVEQALSLLLIAFGITIVIDAIFLAVISLMRAMVSFLTGRTLEQRA
jgi:hypothetical protein